MITETIRRMVEDLAHVFIATADRFGKPHIAIGHQISVAGDSLLIFENWFCPTTLQNITCNSHVAVVAVAPDTGIGYQLTGSVVRSIDTAILNGYNLSDVVHEKSQVLTRFTVKVEMVFEFNGSIHSDLPINHERRH